MKKIFEEIKSFRSLLIKALIMLAFIVTGIYLGVGIEIFIVCVIVWLILNKEEVASFIKLGVLLLGISGFCLLVNNREVANLYAAFSYLSISIGTISYLIKEKNEK